jgi:hypothetical protein
MKLLGNVDWVSTIKINYWSDIFHSLDTKNKCEFDEIVYQIFIDFMEHYDSDRREVLCNILIEFEVPMKPVRLFKMCKWNICKNSYR